MYLVSKTKQKQIEIKLLNSLIALKDGLRKNTIYLKENHLNTFYEQYIK